MRRHRDGFSIHLTAEQSELIMRLLDELAEMLTDEEGPDRYASDRDHTTAGRLARLFPPAYAEPEHSDREDEYQRLMRAELVQSRLASISTLRECLGAPRQLTEAHMAGFMQSINALRLVIGTILGITEADPEPDLNGREDPNFGLQMTYDFLSWLLESAVRAAHT